MAKAAAVKSLTYSIAMIVLIFLFIQWATLSRAFQLLSFPMLKGVEPKDAKEKSTQEEKKAQQSSGPPKKKSKDDFTFMKILGEGSYSTVDVR